MSGTAPAAVAAQFDVVILGGGSAGCVLASRLSEDPQRRVLLVEAGRPARRCHALLHRLALSRAGLFQPGQCLAGLSVGMGRAAGNTGGATVRPYEQARILGGGSDNGIGANRGSPHDYDEWVEEGATGWGWTDVRPVSAIWRPISISAPTAYCMATVGHCRSSACRAVSTPPSPTASRREAGREGHASREDQNGVWEDGIFPITVNLDRAGGRTSTATVYLSEAVRQRSNLTLWTETQAERLLFEGQRVTGAKLRRQEQEITVAASLVIVSTGALHSPALLMRSGLGPGRLTGGAGHPDCGGAQRRRAQPVGTSLDRRLRLHPRDARLPAGDRYHIQVRSCAGPPAWREPRRATCIRRLIPARAGTPSATASPRCSPGSISPTRGAR